MLVMPTGQHLHAKLCIFWEHGWKYVILNMEIILVLTYQVSSSSKIPFKLCNDLDMFLRRFDSNPWWLLLCYGSRYFSLKSNLKYTNSTCRHSWLLQANVDNPSFGANVPSSTLSIKSCVSTWVLSRDIRNIWYSYNIIKLKIWTQKICHIILWTSSAVNVAFSMCGICLPT